MTDFAGNARLTVDGVTVEADRIVLENGKATPEGNVRLTVPRGRPCLWSKELRDTTIAKKTTVTIRE